MIFSSTRRFYKKCLLPELALARYTLRYEVDDIREPDHIIEAQRAHADQKEKERQRKERVAAEKEARRTAKLAHKNSSRKGPVHQVCRADLGVQNNRADSDV